MYILKWVLPNIKLRSNSMRETLERLNVKLMSDDSVWKYRRSERSEQRRYSRESEFNGEAFYLVGKQQRTTLGVLKCILGGGTGT